MAKVPKSPRRKIAENYNCLSRVHERYRRQTDGRATANSERERESRSLITVRRHCGGALSALPVKTAGDRGYPQITSVLDYTVFTAYLSPQGMRRLYRLLFVCVCVCVCVCVSVCLSVCRSRRQ